MSDTYLSLCIKLFKLGQNKVFKKIAPSTLKAHWNNILLLMFIKHQTWMKIYLDVERKKKRQYMTICQTPDFHKESTKNMPSGLEKHHGSKHNMCCVLSIILFSCAVHFERSHPHSFWLVVICGEHNVWHVTCNFTMLW